MGTNFQWHIPNADKPLHEVLRLPYHPDFDGLTLGTMLDDDHPLLHIGKRSAAGPYCWDCSLTLCMAGEAGIHYSRNNWYDACPKCGQSPNVSLEESAVGLELGFAKTLKRTGVTSCCSFSWAQDPERVFSICKAPSKYYGASPAIEDEYGRLYTGDEFMNMLDEMCPIRYMDSIGTRFS